jgi:hypothetical protein
MNKFTCMLKRDADESELAELCIEISHKSFSGFGSCYVSIPKLKNDAITFGIYPLPAGGTAAIEGGFFKNDMISLEETHLHISAVPLGRLGNVQLRILLSNRVDDQLKDDLMKLECKILTSYEQLRLLSNSLVSLADGTVGDFEIIL